MRRILLALLFALAWPYTLAAQAIAPELPRAVPVAVAAPTRVVQVPAGADLQAALDSAKSGDALALACGATYTGNFILARSGVTLQPSCLAGLPAAGTRMTPAIAARLTLPRILSPNSDAAITAASGAHHYRLVGIEVSVAFAVTTNYGLVNLGVSETTLAAVPHDLVLERVYVHGTPTVSLSRCVLFNSGAAALVDSYLSECHAEGQDAQAIAGWNGPGPFTIVNNYLEGSGENVMFGGADPVLVGNVPSDIEIRGNSIAKPAAWIGGRWSIKNLLELKSAQRVLIEGNVFDGAWAQAQTGYAVLMKSSNQSKACTWCFTGDVTFRRNIIRNVGAGFALAAAPNDPGYDAIPAARIAITDNLILGIDSGSYRGEGRAFTITGNLADLAIVHNTILSPTLSFMFAGQGHDTLYRFTLRDNLAGGGKYGYGGDGAGGLLGWQQYVAGGAMAGNVFIMADGPGTTYPPGNAFPKTLADVGVANDDRLAPSSPFAGTASDGKDPGADIPAVLLATAHAIDGASATPPPAPSPTISLTQLRSAITAIDKVVGSTGRENAATKAALAPVAVYLHALLVATP